MQLAACSLSICCVNDAIYIHPLNEFFFLSENYADSVRYRYTALKVVAYFPNAWDAAGKLSL